MPQWLMGRCLRSLPLMDRFLFNEGPRSHMAKTETTCARIQLSSWQRPSINAHAYAGARDRRLNLPHATNHNPAYPYHLVDHWTFAHPSAFSITESKRRRGWCCSRRRKPVNWMCRRHYTNQCLRFYMMRTQVCRRT